MAHNGSNDPYGALLVSFVHGELSEDDFEHRFAQLYEAGDGVEPGEEYRDLALLLEEARARSLGERELRRRAEHILSRRSR